MKKATLLGLTLIIGLSLGAQNVPIDFEAGGHGANFTWAVFENDANPALEIIANPDPSGINTSSTVAKFTALQTGNPWAGCETLHGTDVGPFTMDATNSTIRIMVWKSVISDVGIKLVTATGWAKPELKVANTKINEWEQLTFDFSTVNHESMTYDQIVIFPDFDPRTADNIVFFDNVWGVQASIGLDENLAENEVTLYPNPSNGRYNVESNSNLEKIEILSLDGRVLFTEVPNTNKYSLEISEFANGMYLMRVQANNKTEIHRLIKSN